MQDSHAWPVILLRLTAIDAKKDRIVCTTRSKSREETPKEGMDRKPCPR
jgi:hypothetical protein